MTPSWSSFIRMESPDPHHSALRVLHYVFPAILLAYYVIAEIISICTLQNLRSRGHKINRKLIVLLQCAVLTLYAIEAVLLVLNSSLSLVGKSSTDDNIYVLLEVLIWVILSATLLESGNDIVWYPLYGSWTISIVMETVLFSFEIPTTAQLETEAPRSLKYVRMSFQVLRLAFLALLMLLYFHRYTAFQNEKDEESTSLFHSADMSNAKGLSGLANYGSVQVASTRINKDGDEEEEQAKKDWIKEAHLQRLKESGNWINYLKRFFVFAPLLWPAGQWRVQLSILGVVVCLIAGRVLNLLVPRQLGIVINSLSDTLVTQGKFPGLQLGLFVLYRFLASYKTMGELEGILWLPFGQHAAKRVKTTAHRQVMALSRDFQTQKSSGEIMRTIDQGLTVIWLFRNATMYLIPCALDMLISGIYLSSVFGVYMALLLNATAILYLWVSANLTTKRINPQREALKMDRREAQVLYESVSEWDTVSYFGGQAYENVKLSKTISIRLLAEYMLRWLVFQGSWFEEAVVQSGFAVACTLVIYQILQGTQRIGSFAMMIFYFLNASSDLKSLTVMGSSLLRDLVEAETLRDLLLTKPSIEDGPMPFRFYEGAILFSDVSFGYNHKKTVLQNFNFSATAGQRIALVGETGAGKTTLLRLLFRFYDVQTGKIMIDGQDICNVTLRTLRNAMGVVPQDPSLFDNSIMENVRYARLEASDAEVIEACKAAAIHDRILSYTDGYHTRVGERGIKLSGGEKQRIAIARIMLKNSKIILLDEATSSVDSETEALIQTALQRLTRGKTTFTIAHRLSTVKHSDVVLVMKGGRIVEQGSPDELLAANGHFARLWRSQFTIEATGTTHDTTSQGQDDNSQHAKPTLKHHISERSGSSFRPNAPEFVPHYQRGTETTNGTQCNTQLGASHQHHSQDMKSHIQSHGAPPGKIDRGISKRTHAQRSKKGTKLADESKATSEAVTTNTFPVTSVSQYDGLVSEMPMDSKPPARLNRWQRRRQARSEPLGSSIVSSHTDSASKSPNAGKSRANFDSRRVSGPGNFPSGATTLESSEIDPKHGKGQLQNVRRKRQRQLRIKGREGSGSGLGVVAGEVSSAHPSDTLVEPRFVTPISASKDEENHPISKDINHDAKTLGRSSTGNVRFAPGA